MVICISPKNNVRTKTYHNILLPCTLKVTKPEKYVRKKSTYFFLFSFINPSVMLTLHRHTHHIRLHYSHLFTYLRFGILLRSLRGGGGGVLFFVN